MRIVWCAFLTSLLLSCAEILYNTAGEPDGNDSFSTADTLVADSTVSLYISPKGDADYFRTSILTPGKYNVGIPSTTGTYIKLGVTLYDSAQTQIATWVSGDDFALLEKVNLGIGLYYIRIVGLTGDGASSTTINLSIKHASDSP